MEEFRALIRIPELMTNIMSYINIDSMLLIFSSKQLEYFWEYLSEDTKKQFAETTFIKDMRFVQTSHNNHNYIQLATLSTYFYFFNKNWKLFILPYVQRAPGKWSLTIANKVVKTAKTRMELRQYITERVHRYFLENLCRLADHGKTEEESIYFARFILSIRDIIGPNAFFTIRRCMAPTFAIIEMSLYSVYENSDVFYERVRMLKALNHQLCNHEHPVFYCRHLVASRHIPLIHDYLMSGEDGESRETQLMKVCMQLVLRSSPMDYYMLSQYMWNWGCRCRNHVDFVNEIISYRFPKLERATHAVLFERQTNLADYCNRLTKTGETTVSKKIYVAMFQHGCRCPNH